MAARTFPPARSRIFWSCIPASPRRPSARPRILSWANRYAPSWCPARASASTSTSSRAHFAGLGVARHKTPERVEAVTDLPRTPTGKVKKTELRALLRDEAGATVRSES